LFAEGCGVEGGIAVAYGDRGDLCIAIYCQERIDEEEWKKDLHVEEDISVRVVDVVSEALLVIGYHVQAPGVEDLVQILNDLLALRTWNSGLDDWACGLIWEEGSFASWL
jgi:hypothetical protein